MGSFRIVHFSDLHVGDFSFPKNGWLDKRLLGRANFWLTRRRQICLQRLAQAAEVFAALQPDLVLCTGDLTCVSDPKEFAMAEELLAPIRQWAGDKFVYLPGNHDAYVSAGECRRALAETFYRLNGQRFQLPELPLSLRFGEVELLLLNTAVPQGWFSSGGVFAAAAQQRLDTLLTEPFAGIRLLVNHFPIQTETGGQIPWRRRLQGAGVLRQWQSAGRFAAFLCGHIHHPFLADTAVGLQVCAGSLTIQSSYSNIEIDLSGRHNSRTVIGKEAINATISRL